MLDSILTILYSRSVMSVLFSLSGETKQESSLLRSMNWTWADPATGVED
jgi:hypothetical protein